MKQLLKGKGYGEAQQDFPLPLFVQCLTVVSRLLCFCLNEIFILVLLTYRGKQIQWTNIYTQELRI